MPSDRNDPAMAFFCAGCGFGDDFAFPSARPYVLGKGVGKGCWERVLGKAEKEHAAGASSDDGKIRRHTPG